MKKRLHNADNNNNNYNNKTRIFTGKQWWGLKLRNYTHTYSDTRAFWVGREGRKTQISILKYILKLLNVCTVLNVLCTQSLATCLCVIWIRKSIFDSVIPLAMALFENERNDIAHRVTILHMKWLHSFLKWSDWKYVCSEKHEHAWDMLENRETEREFEWLNEWNGRLIHTKSVQERSR